MHTKNDAFLTIAVAAARSAGTVILENLGRLSKDDVGRKQAFDFVTRVDRESEEVIMGTIREKFPHHLFLAEESVKDTESDEYRWIVDPLDGTTNYIHGFPIFSVSIALQYRREIVLGVVFDPLRGELFTAELGRGAFLNGEVIRVSAVSDLRDGLVATGFPFRMKEFIDPHLRLFRNIFHRVGDLRRAGSAALDMACVACGRCDGFFELGLNPWDIAAGSILIREAGGIVSDFEGGRSYLLTGNIVAGNPALHPEILGEVRKVFAGLMDR